MGVIAILMLLAFSLPWVSLRLSWAMNRLAFQAASEDNVKEEDKVIIT